MIAHTAFPDVTLDDIAAELRREGEARARLYPQRVDSGRMTPDEAERGRAICAAMLADIARIHPPIGSTPAGHDFTWTDRRIALQRELALRARFYPEWIAGGKLAQAEADRRTRRLTALLWIYDDGFDYRSSNGLRPPFIGDDDDQRTARIEARIHCMKIYDQRGNAPMAEGMIQMIALQNPTLAAELSEARRPHEQKEMAL